jgi:hypothetical protein
MELSKKYPDPQQWGGEPKELPGFLLLLKIKLKKNADWYPTETDRLEYVVGRLKGKPLRVVAPFVENGRFSTCEDLYNMLRRLAGKTFSKEVAVRKLQALKQGTTTLPEFLGEFDHLAEEADADDSTRQIFLRNAINEDLSDRMVGQAAPRSYTELVGLLVTLDDNLKQHRAVHPQKKQTAFRAVSTVRTATMTSSNALAIVPGVRSETNGHLASANGYAPKNSELRDYRRKNNLCFACGSDEHQSKDCAQRSNYRQREVRETRLLRDRPHSPTPTIHSRSSTPENV